MNTSASRLATALEDLNAAVAKGIEFPDALFSVSFLLRVSYAKLQAAYDTQAKATLNEKESTK